MIRRVRAHAGPWALIAVLGLTMVCVLAATPRTVNRISDNALRRAVAQAPFTTRDLTFVQPTSPRVRSELGPEPSLVDGLGQLLQLLPDALRQAVGAKWGAVGTGLFDLDGPGVTTEPDGVKPRANLWHLAGLEREIVLTEGRLPATRSAPPGAAEFEIEVVVAATVADRLGLRVGERYSVNGLPVRVVGRFAPNDAAGPVWDQHPSALQTGYIPWSEGRIRLTGTLFTDLVGIATLFDDAPNWQMLTTARFRLDEHRLHAGLVADLRAGVFALRSDPALRAADVGIDTRLDELLTDFQHAEAAARALLAVVGAGIAGAGLGLLVLAARLAVERRRDELHLLRARGASLARLGATLGTEAFTVVVPAMLVGWLARYLVPGRGGISLRETAPVLAVAAVALFAVPVAGLIGQRDRPADQPDRAPGGGRRDIVLRRPGPRRLVAELAIVVLAGLGVVLLHRRGLVVAGVDPYLSAVPVLVAVAAGLAGLRAYPAPVRLLGRLTRRRRSAPAFLGLARAGRGGGAVALPLVVLVLAVALGGFAGAIRSGIAAARDVAAVTEVGADFRLTAPRFTPDAVQAVAAVPGVRTVVAVHRAEGRVLVLAGRAQPDSVVVVGTDPAEYERLVTSYRIDLRLPPQIRGAGGGAEPVPVVASPALAARFGADAALAAGASPLRLVGTVDRLPGLDAGEAEFLLVPRAALGADAPVTVLLVSGSGVDAAALRRAAGGDGGDAELTSLAERRRAVEESAFNDGITAAFTLGLLGGGLAGVLAVALTLVTAARARGRVLSLLRTLGLSVRQARGVLLVELAPLMLTALLIGAGVGSALPLLLGPALGLTAFTAGVPLSLSFDATTVGVLAVLFVALVGAAIVTETAANRRLGLGRVLRLGDME